MTLFWLAALIVCLAAEAATVGLVSIWFAAGSLAALICAAFGGWLWLQIVLFIIVSAVMLCFTRPLAKKYLNPARKATNADRVIGSLCTVTEDIDNIAGAGTVSAGGKLWTARSLTGEGFKKGDIVRVSHIEGVKLIVMPPVPAEEAAEEILPEPAVETEYAENSHEEV